MVRALSSVRAQCTICSMYGAGAGEGRSAEVDVFGKCCEGGGLVLSKSALDSQSEMSRYV